MIWFQIPISKRQLYKTDYLFFQKLTANSDNWYQIKRPRNTEESRASEKPEDGAEAPDSNNTETMTIDNQTQKKEKKPKLHRSCKLCGEPVVQKLDLEGKKFQACKRYPHCGTAISDADSSEEEDKSVYYGVVNWYRIC